MKPLSGIRVVDLTRLLSGPFATQALADLGAEVIKVEPPSGDRARRNGPLVSGQSTYFASLNRGKKSLVLNLKDARAREALLRLVQTVDVVVENFRPGVMARLGLGYPVLRETNSRLVYVSCTGFGQTGPLGGRPALDIVIQARAGTMQITGAEGGEPARVGFSIGDLGGGLYTTLGVLAGLQQRERTGAGVHIDVSMLDAQVSLLENAFARFFATGAEPVRLGTRHPVLAPFQAFWAADRMLVVAASTDVHWRALLSVLGLQELADNPAYREAGSRQAHHSTLAAALEARFRERNAGDWLERLAEAGVPSGPVNHIGETAAEPQLIHRQVFRDVESDGVPMRVVGPPYQFDGDPLPVSDHVPTLGEHTRSLLRDIGYTGDEIAQLLADGSASADEGGGEG